MEIIDIEENSADVLVRKKSLCSKFINRTTYSYLLNGVLRLALLASFILGLYFFKDYLKVILYWVETQNPWIIFLLFVGSFILVSFPIMIGYLLLIITSGYLFGIIRGLATVVICANLGVAVAHFILKAIGNKFSLHHFIKNDTTRALLKVISGPQAFKIVLLARLTPIPFGLQNTVFALSNLSGCGYHVATCIGLFPAQLINVYLGSTLRSMHDVLQESHVTGYIVFAFQILIGFSLMVWVVQKARKELTLAIMEAELGREGMSTSSSSASVS